MNTTLRNPAAWLVDFFKGETQGSIPVTEKSLLSNGTFWYGVNRISGNVASLPLNCRRRMDRGSEKAKEHMAYQLFRKRPNNYQTPFVFKQSLTKDAIMWGNGRAAIYRGQNPELIPMLPDRTVSFMVDGEKWHASKPQRDERLSLHEDMMTDLGGCVVKPDSDVLHIQGFGNGVEGFSLIEYARQSMQVTLGADKRAGRQMQKGFAGKIMLEEPAEARIFQNEEEAKLFLEQFKAKHGEDGEGNEVGLLRQGIKANVLQMSNRDAQFLDLRKFQREETAFWLMLETILGSKDSVSYNSEEQRQLAYLKNCLGNWLTRWEEEADAKLLSPREFLGDTHYHKFNVAALLRTDTATTIGTMSQAIASRIYSPNEAREKLDENPYEGGDDYFNPAITPGSGESQEQVSAAIVSRIENLMNVEQKRVNTFLTRGDDFEKIESWYEGWLSRLTSVVEELGGDHTIAQEHCVSSLKYIKNGPESFDLNGSAELIAKEIQQCLT